MQTVGLTWQHSGETAAVLALAGGALSLSRRRVVQVAGAVARETAVIGVLYGLWQLAGEISLTGTGAAFSRSLWIQRFEAHLPLPSEHTAQQLLLGHRYVVEAANLYYAGMHFSVMLGFLLWLFLRHRDRYRPIRHVMAWTTLACLAVQMLPVAPPRMLPGFVDTGMLYDQSVYSNGLPIDQLSAMPSVHVAWAVLVGWYAWRVSPSRWRWAGPAHAVLMVFIVTATANHWWLDGIVAVLLLSASAWAVHGARRAWAVVRARRAGWDPAVLEPAVLSSSPAG